ncbi:MAG: PilN domain-containing protein, partial [Pseudomonadota bacterium]
LTYQLDQLSPFRADQVYFDQRVRQETKPSDTSHAGKSKRNQIQVELRLVPKPQLAPLLERLKAIEIAVHKVDTLSDGQQPRPEGFNLLPVEQRAVYVHERARFNGWLALSLVVLLGLVMAQSLWLRQNKTEQLQVEADRLRVEAREVAQLQQELEQSLLAASFLSERRASQPAAIELLAEMTAILPNDIWLQRFQIQGDRVTVQGLADGSQRIIEIMNDSPLLDSPGFERAISIDQASGQENFTTTAVLLPYSMIDLDSAEQTAADETDPVEQPAPANEEGV